MENDSEILLTKAGEAKLRRELEELTGPRRTELAARLRHAIQQGDLSENADYTAAKEDQAFLEGRIQEIERVLKNARIVDTPTSNETVQIGSTVIVAEAGGDSETFRIVGAKEADPRNGMISHESPIGGALIGKRVGEKATASTPGGDIVYTILQIE